MALIYFPTEKLWNLIESINLVISREELKLSGKIVERENRYCAGKYFMTILDNNSVI